MKRISSFEFRVPGAEWQVGSSGKCILMNRWRLFLVFMLFLSTAGCEEEVVSVLGTDRPFSLFGVFSPQLDTQWVRVYPIDDVLEIETDDLLDARFTSTDIESGELRVWRDSVITELNGQFAHVFYSPFTAEYGHTYQVHIERFDGATTSVEAAVPVSAELELLDPVVSPASHPVFVNAPVPHLFAIEVTYTVSYQLPGTPQVTARFQVNYDGFARQENGGWVINVQLWQDFRFIKDALVEEVELTTDAPITLQEMALDLVIANREWNPPGGNFDPEVLVQPGLLSNVENGFGFVGAGYRRDIRWLPTAAVIIAAGFVPPPDDGGMNPGG